MTKNTIIGITAVSVVGLSAAAFLVINKNDKSSTNQETTQSTQTNNSTTIKSYKDGSYTANGQYFTPGGAEQVVVALTIKENKIESVTFEGKATDSESKTYQNMFKQNFESRVVGKKLDEVSLNKISGSSLTSKGFMDALSKIKTQAS